MRPLSELIDKEDSAWPLVQQWMAEASVSVEVLPLSDSKAGEEALVYAQVTTRSPMGAIAFNTAGIFIDSGWLRVLGAGLHPRFRRSLPSWNQDRSDGYYLVADDVLGGYFAINGGALGDDPGKVYYYAPDALAWEPCGLSYSQFLGWAMSGKLDEFYTDFRWQDWETEVKELTGDQVLSVYPFLWAEGLSLGERDRRPVDVAEYYSLQADIQRQPS
jgi:hypothetical protein